MTQDVIPKDVKQFLLQHIHSVAQLEGLLLLRTHLQNEWSAESLAKALYIPLAQASALLNHLVEQGFVVKKISSTSTSFQYGPVSSEIETMIERVADLHARYLVPVTHFIHSQPKTRIQEFADAFRIRKD